jgi:NTE family protein
MSQFKNLAFEGGGVRGIAYAGALQVLEQNKILPDIRRVAGTSAGAITATLVALGASSDKVLKIVGGTDFRAFMDDSFGVIRDMHRLLDDYGWYKGDAFSAWIQKQIGGLGQSPSLTFAQLHQLAAQPQSTYRDLFVVGTDLSRQIPTVYSAEATPDYEIWQAVRISMSIPLFFAAVKGPPNNQVLVDGGVTWNYPLDLFDDTKYLIDRAAAEIPTGTRYDANHVYNKETLGFRVDTFDEIAAEKNSWNLPPRQINDFFDYIKALVGFMTDTANKLHLKPADWDRTVVIDAAGVNSTDFSLSDDKVKLLMQNGVTGTQHYLDWFTSPTSDPQPLNRVSPLVPEG